MSRLLHSRKVIQGLALLLVLIGGIFAVRYAQRSMNAYRAIQFAAQNDFDAGNLDVSLIRPWMTIRYVAEAYAVPQIFLFDELNMPMERKSSDLPMGKLNARLHMGQGDDEPALVENVRQAILAYRRNPVVTGLAERHVQDWMNMQYLANSTGIPVEDLFAEVGIPVDGHAYMPLGRLVKQTGYEPGIKSLLDTLQQTVDEHQAAPQ